jgi:two-component system, cell cycle sensor histidine kinase and response regulator CckA
MISQSQCNTIETTKLYEHLSDLSILFRRLLAPNIDFQIRLAADLWPVRANMAALEQALITLVVKARDAMPMGGSLLFHARNVDEATCRSISGLYLSGDHVLIEIIDTGVGIAPEYLKRIFDPFFVTKGPVNGIALAKAYWAIKDMNGHLTVKSAIGKGTRFNVFMPRSPS